MLHIEDKLQTACNEVGLLSTEMALKRFDTDGSPIVVGRIKYTAKNRNEKGYQPLYGAAKVTRYVYKTERIEVKFIVHWRKR